MRLPQRSFIGNNVKKLWLPALLVLASSTVQANQGEAGDIQQAEEETIKTIVLINPNSNSTATNSMAGLAQQEVAGRAHVQGVSNESAPALLTTPEDMKKATSGVVALGKEAAANKQVAALIVSAFSDPGLPELRASVSIPVFGIGEEVFHEAARGERPFGIVTVTPDEQLLASFQQKANELGYGHLYRGVQVTPGDPMKLVASAERLDAALATAVQASIEQNGAEAVIMGGGPLSASAIRLQPQFDVPLLVAVHAAARAALDVIK